MARKLKSDKWLFGAAFFLVCVSVVMVNSALAGKAMDATSVPVQLMARQATWVLVGALLMVVVMRIDYRAWQHPTVINTAVGVRSINPDYLNVGRVLRLSTFTMMRKIIIPATMPYVFTGYRLSLGIAWLVIVAAEMLTGAPGVGGFLWQEYNSLVYAHILLAIITIGLIGFCLDRLMGVAERKLRTA